MACAGSRPDSAWPSSRTTRAARARCAGRATAISVCPARPSASTWTGDSPSRQRCPRDAAIPRAETDRRRRADVERAAGRRGAGGGARRAARRRDGGGDRCRKPRPPRGAGAEGPRGAGARRVAIGPAAALARDLGADATATRARGPTSAGGARAVGPRGGRPRGRDGGNGRGRRPGRRAVPAGWPRGADRAAPRAERARLLSRGAARASPDRLDDLPGRVPGGDGAAGLRARSAWTGSSPTASRCRRSTARSSPTARAIASRPAWPSRPDPAGCRGESAGCVNIDAPAAV